MEHLDRWKVDKWILNVMQAMYRDTNNIIISKTESRRDSLEVAWFIPNGREKINQERLLDKTK